MKARDACCVSALIRLRRANRAGPFFHLIPLFGAAPAIALLGERPQFHHAIGAVLIIGGVALASRNRGGRVMNRVAPESGGT